MTDHKKTVEGAAEKVKEVFGSLTGGEMIHPHDADAMAEKLSHVEMDLRAVAREFPVAADPLSVYRRLDDEPAAYAAQAASALAAEIFAKDPTVSKIEIDMVDEGPWLYVHFGPDDEKMPIGETRFAAEDVVLERIAKDLFRGADERMGVYAVPREGSPSYSAG